MPKLKHPDLDSRDTVAQWIEEHCNDKDRRWLAEYCIDHTDNTGQLKQLREYLDERISYEEAA